MNEDELNKVWADLHLAEIFFVKCEDWSKRRILRGEFKRHFKRGQTLKRSGS